MILEIILNEEEINLFNEEEKEEKKETRKSNQ